jgi:MraZ protein
VDRNPIFVGEHDLMIDEKNRLLIPAQFRKKIVPEVDGSMLFITLKMTDYGFVPWFYAEGFFRRLIEKHSPAVLTPDDEQLDYTHRIISMADEIEWDSQGRVVLPPKILGPAELGVDRCREVTLIGAKDHFELWKRPQWQARRASLIEQSAKIDKWAQKTQRAAQQGNGNVSQPNHVESQVTDNRKQNGQDQRESPAGS